MVRQGMLPKDTVLSADQLMNRIMEELGRTEAIKQNTGWFKKTVHFQDFTFAGEEADNEEFLPYEKYVGYILSKPHEDENIDLLRQHGISVAGIYQKLQTLVLLLIYSRDKEQLRRLFPHPSVTLQAFFQGYFRNLDDKYLKAFVNDAYVSQQLRKDFGFDWFYSKPAINRSQHDQQLQEIWDMILQWAKDEAEERLNRKGRNVQNMVLDTNREKRGLDEVYMGEFPDIAQLESAIIDLYNYDKINYLVVISESDRASNECL
jgi:hypothetical protein